MQRCDAIMTIAIAIAPSPFFFFLPMHQNFHMHKAQGYLQPPVVVPT
jgi:hypothetical protein